MAERNPVSNKNKNPITYTAEGIKCIASVIRKLEFVGIPAD
jgi:hypothetical protein